MDFDYLIDLSMANRTFILHSHWNFDWISIQYFATSLNLLILQGNSRINHLRSQSIPRISYNTRLLIKIRLTILETI